MDSTDELDEVTNLIFSKTEHFIKLKRKDDVRKIPGEKVVHHHHHHHHQGERGVHHSNPKLPGFVSRPLNQDVSWRNIFLYNMPCTVS